MIIYDPQPLKEYFSTVFFHDYKISIHISIYLWTEDKFSFKWHDKVLNKKNYIHFQAPDQNYVMIIA